MIPWKSNCRSDIHGELVVAIRSKISTIQMENVEKISQELEDAINVNWDEKKISCPKIFDGPVWRVIGYQRDALAFQDKDTNENEEPCSNRIVDEQEEQHIRKYQESSCSELILSLTLTSYRYLMYQKPIIRKIVNGEFVEPLYRNFALSHNGLGVGALVVLQPPVIQDSSICDSSTSSFPTILLAKRSKHTPVAPNTWCYCGGTLDAPDPEGVVWKELLEEFAISPKHVIEFKPLGLWDTGSVHGWIPALMYLCVINLSFSTLRDEIWPTASDKAEHEELVQIGIDGIGIELEGKKDTSHGCCSTATTSLNAVVTSSIDENIVLQKSKWQDTLNNFEKITKTNIMPFARTLLEYYGIDIFSKKRHAV